MFWSIANFCAICGAAFMVSLTACGLLRSFAIRRALVDVPNERSLHTVPVPRLGGVGIVCGVWIVAVVTALLSQERVPRDVVVLFAGSLLIAAVGLADDLRPMSAGPRLIVQCAIVTGVVLLIGTPGSVVIAADVSLALPSWAASGLWIVWIVGVLNIYNFMDGMDGLAGCQAVAAGIGIAAAAAVHGDFDLALISALIACASAGFFLHNVGPARIFMGDAGSTMIGFALAAIALAAHARPDPLPVAVVPLALAPFLLDGTFTLVRRALLGEAIWKAHRTHLYQRAVTAGLTHRDVLTPYAAWAAAGAIAAALGARASGGAMVALVVVVSLGLAAMWTWVVRLEKRRDERDKTRGAGPT